ncbi:MAG: CAP domain-containing protein [Chloroflexota bacterium]
MLVGAVALAAWAPGPVATQIGAQEGDVRQRVVDLTNAERMRAGLAPLRSDPRLTTASRRYADFQAQGDCTGHFCDGSPADRARRAGYPSEYVGENWAGGYQTPEEVVGGWMASEGHRANILKPDYQAIGVGMARRRVRHHLGPALW